MQLTTLFPLAITTLLSAGVATASSSSSSSSSSLTNRRHASPIDVNSYLHVSCPGTSVPAQQYITFGIAQAKKNHDIWSSWVAVCCPADTPNLDKALDPVTDGLKCYNAIYDNPNFQKPAPRVSPVVGQACQNGAGVCDDHPRGCCWGG